MFERESRLNGLMFGVLLKVLDDTDEAQLSLPVVEGGNSPAFILGHLAVINDYGLKILGEPRVAPQEWHKRFRPGAMPQDDIGPLPTKAELLQVLGTGQQRILAAAKNADPEKMNEPTTSDFFKGTPVETIGDVLAHMMTSHLAFHAGQISAWRRLQGKPHIF